MRTELVTTLKRRATELLNQLEADREPVLITQHGVPSAYLVSLIVTVATTTVVWVSVTFLGPETSRETLVKFFRLVRRPARGGLT